VAFWKRARIAWLVWSAVLLVGLGLGRALAEEPPQGIGDIFRKAQGGSQPDKSQAPEEKQSTPAAEPGDAKPTDENQEGKPEGISYAEWGQQLRARDELPEAIAALSEAIRLDPDDAASYRERGWAELDSGKPGEALADFQRAFELDRDDYDARRGRGLTFSDLGEFEPAMYDANYLVEHEPGNPHFRCMRGYLWAEWLSPDRALVDYSEAVRLAPDSAMNHQGLAKTLSALGRFPEAIEELNHAIRLNKNDAGSYRRRASAHGALGDWQPMIDDLTEVLRVDSKWPEDRIQRAAAYTLAGQVELADTDYLTASVQILDYQLAKWEPVLFQSTAALAEETFDAEPDPANIVAEFPIPLARNGILVPIQFGGRMMRFIIDTGASCTVIDRSHVDLLKPLGRGEILGTSSGVMEMPLYEPIRLSLGTVGSVTTDGPVGCYDLAIASGWTRGRIDGVLGLDVLAQFVVRFDLARHKVYFLRSCGDEDGVAIPFVKGTGDKIDPSDPHSIRRIPQVALQLPPGGEILIELDTGKVSGSVGIERDRYEALVREHQITPLRIAMIGTVEQWRFSPVGILKHMDLAGFEHRNISIDLNEMGNALGLHYLARYVATFDFPNRRLLLKPSSLFDVSEAELALRLGKDWVEGIKTHTMANARRRNDQMVAMHPRNVAAYQSRGMFAAEQGDFDRAIIDFTTAIELERPTAELLYRRGLAYRGKGRCEQAITDFSGALALEPGNARLFFERGTTCLMHRRFEGAVADLSRAIDSVPAWAEAYRQRGTAYYFQHDLVRALADFTVALRLEPESDLARKSVDFLLAAQRKEEPSAATASSIAPTCRQGRLFSRWRARRCARIGRWR
jgi:tetratricopeptide (TPR) repeat protein